MRKYKSSTNSPPPFHPQNPLKIEISNKIPTTIYVNFMVQFCLQAVKVVIVVKVVDVVKVVEVVKVVALLGCLLKIKSSGDQRHRFACLQPVS